MHCEIQSALPRRGAVEGEVLAVEPLRLQDLDVERGLIEGILTGSGLEVQTAPTGAAGVDAVREHVPDVIVVVFGLPDYSGTEAIRRIREFSHAPVLMLTGHGDLAKSLYEAASATSWRNLSVPRNCAGAWKNCSRSGSSPRRTIPPRVDHAPGLGRQAAAEEKLIEMLPSPSTSSAET